MYSRKQRVLNKNTAVKREKEREREARIFCDHYFFSFFFELCKVLHLLARLNYIGQGEFRNHDRDMN